MKIKNILLIIFLALIAYNVFAEEPETKLVLQQKRVMDETIKLFPKENKEDHCLRTLEIPHTSF